MLLLAGGSPMAHAKENIRKAAVSGQFYPSNPQKLKKEIQKLLAQAHSRPDPDVTALIVPHAGYPYSGPVAAEAYKTVQGRKFESVVIVAFLHQVFLPGVLVDAVDFYETPLGRVPVDGELVKKNKKFQPRSGRGLGGRSSGTFPGGSTAFFTGNYSGSQDRSHLYRGAVAREYRGACGGA